MDFIEIFVFPWVFLTCHMKNTQKNSCCVIVKDVHLKFSRIFVVKSCLEKTRLLILLPAVKNIDFSLKNLKLTNKIVEMRCQIFPISLFDQSHPGCFSRYVESFIRGVMGFVVRFLACGRSCHNKESHFFPFQLICLTESSAKADRGALSMAKSPNGTTKPITPLWNFQYSEKQVKQPG